MMGYRISRSNMTGKSESSFAVVRFNKRTYQSGGVVAVIKGTKTAEIILKDFDSLKSEKSRRAGWGYFLEKTDLPPGMDPEKATKLRQVRLDSQESRALCSVSHKTIRSQGKAAAS
jgi:hypothetical protein